MTPCCGLNINLYNIGGVVRPWSLLVNLNISADASSNKIVNIWAQSAEATLKSCKVALGGASERHFTFINTLLGDQTVNVIICSSLLFKGLETSVHRKSKNFIVRRRINGVSRFVDFAESRGLAFLVESGRL
jgi:hypothetical protein